METTWTATCNRIDDVIAIVWETCNMATAWTATCHRVDCVTALVWEPLRLMLNLNVDMASAYRATWRPLGVQRVTELTVLLH